MQDKQGPDWLRTMRVSGQIKPGRALSELLLSHVGLGQSRTVRGKAGTDMGRLFDRVGASHNLGYYQGGAQGEGIGLTLG